MSYSKIPDEITESEESESQDSYNHYSINGYTVYTKSIPIEPCGWKIHIPIDNSTEENVNQAWEIVHKIISENFNSISEFKRFNAETELYRDYPTKMITIYIRPEIDGMKWLDWINLLETLEQAFLSEGIRQPADSQTQIGDKPLKIGEYTFSYRHDGVPKRSLRRRAKIKGYRCIKKRAGRFNYVSSLGFIGEEDFNYSGEKDFFRKFRPESSPSALEVSVSDEENRNRQQRRGLFNRLKSIRLPFKRRRKNEENGILLRTSSDEEESDSASPSSNL